MQYLYYIYELVASSYPSWQHYISVVITSYYNEYGVGPHDRVPPPDLTPFSANFIRNKFIYCYYLLPFYM